MSTRLTASNLDRLLHEATEALKGPSPVLEKAATMSKEQLDQQINKRIELVASGNLTDEDFEQVKTEAQTLAIMRLRRG